MRHGAPPKSIKAATITVVPLAGIPFIAAVNDLPKPIGLRREHTRPAHFFAEQARNSQSLIANHFRRQPLSRPASEQAILGVTRPLLRLGRGILLIGARLNDQPHQPLHVPAAVDELGGEPIEQLRMRWPIAARA